MQVWLYFLLTLLIELPIVVLFFKKEWKYALLIGFLVNMFTWPLLHVLLFTTNININILELGVAFAESIGYWLLLKCNWKKAFLLAFLANAVSYGIGEIINSR
jgi:hypothetical protein